MNNEKLNHLFKEIQKEKTETSVEEVSKWIALSAASVGIFGLLSKLKLPYLLTKKIIIMSSIIMSLGIAVTSIVLYSNSNQQVQATPINSKAEVEIQKNPIALNPLIADSIYPAVRTERPIRSVTPTLPILSSEISTVPIRPLATIPIPPNPIKSNESIHVFPRSQQESNSNEDGIRTENRSVDSFFKLKISSSFDVYLSQGNEQKVRLEVDERYISKVETVVNGNQLTVRFAKGSTVNNAKKLAVYITVDNLTEIDISGAVNVQSQMQLNFEKLRMKISGASDIKLDLVSSDLFMDISGASDIKLSGATKNLTAEYSGASDIKMYDFKIQDAEIDISGASNVQLFVHGNLKVDASGASDVRYKGNPSTESIKESGASSVRKKG